MEFSNAHIKETITDKVCGGECSSAITHLNIMNCQEPEDFLHFFPKGFLIL